MKIKVTIFFIAIILSGSAIAQSFDPAVVKKSLVRVKVSLDNTDTKFNVCTGFVWKKPNQVVTSLHAMRPGMPIKVLFLNEAWRTAKIIRVLEKADLVLLEITDAQPVPAGVVPLTSYNDQPVKFGTEIFAMGYNNGATGSSSRTLKKGYVDPENLDNLVPKSDKTALAKIGFPALDLHILYLEGSLLPGYSGSPVFDPQGRLIGIGDGGLEKGASNVSWLIPAKYLTDLENSSSQALPTNFPDMTLLFSAELTEEKAPQQSGNEQNGTTAQTEENPDSQPGEYLEEYGFDEVTPVESSDFEFWLTKNRSLDEMAETSDDPEKLYSITDYIESFNVKLGYEYLRFDIYEDVNHGVIMAVPEGEEVYYDSDQEIFQVDYSENPNVDLFYLGWSDDFSNTDFEQLIAVVLESVPPMIQDEWDVQQFSIDQEFSNWTQIDENRKIAHILMISEDFDDPEFGGLSRVYLYLTILMSYDKTFMGVASFSMSDAILGNATANGVDCENYSSDECDYFENMIKVFGAAHLTTFAY
jgi:hypothetical protein